LLLHVARAGEWADSAPPPDLVKWLGGRVARAEKAALPPSDVLTTAADPTVQARAQAKAQAARDRKKTAGLEDLELWLSDLVREGLLAARARPYSDWDQQAARLIDAQLPGAARQVRQIPELLHDETGEALIAHLGGLWLLAQGWRQRGALQEAEGADLRTALGAPMDRASLLPASPQVWQTLGSVQGEEGKLNVRRTWLLGEREEVALLLDFAPQGQALPVPLPPGRPFTAAVAFAPSAYAQRATVLGNLEAAITPLSLPGGTLAELRGQYAAALALNPWLKRIGAFVGPAYLHLDPPQLCDAEGHAVPLNMKVEQHDLWTLLARAETQMQTYFGEWDGQSFLPVETVCADVTEAHTSRDGAESAETAPLTGVSA